MQVTSNTNLTIFLQKPEAKKKKKKKWRNNMEDAMIDLGDGYDENDTFIDNSEAVSTPVVYD